MSSWEDGAVEVEDRSKLSVCMQLIKGLVSKKWTCVKYAFWQRPTPFTFDDRLLSKCTRHTGHIPQSQTSTATWSDDSREWI